MLRSSLKRVNYVSVCGINHDEAHFKALYIEEVNFLTNQREGYHSIYQRLGGNLGGIEVMVGEIVTEYDMIVMLYQRKGIVTNVCTSHLMNTKSLKSKELSGRTFILKT